MSGPESPRNSQGLMDRYEARLRLEIVELETELRTLEQQLLNKQERVEAGPAGEHEMGKLQKEIDNLQRAVLDKKKELGERKKDIGWSPGADKTRH